AYEGRATAVRFDPAGSRLAVVYHDGRVLVRETPPRDAPPRVAEGPGWDEAAVLPPPGFATRGTELDGAHFVLDDAGALWLLGSRPAAPHPEVDRLGLRELF